DNLEHRVEAAAPLEDHARECPDEGEVARSPSLWRAAALVDPADDLGVDPDAGAEREPPPVHPTGRDVPEPVLCECAGELLGGLDGIPRQAERSRQDARAATRHEPERQVVALDAVQRLVEAAVA